MDTRYKVKWRFKNGYEESRLDIVLAKNPKAAVVEVLRRHIEHENLTRNQIQILQCERMFKDD